MKIISLLTAFLFITSLGSVNAADVNCASPEKTTSDFYHWYLQELNQNKYPLTSSAANDKDRLKKWVSPELLNKLGDYFRKMIWMQSISRMRRIYLMIG
ncbi:YbjP/YqhG family protein [Erwinia amylovora]|uniref:YbjP/YqhG family protein n=1 Tax=Erwinia amylovora TaxID=552 RepID=UPI00211EE662|nr:YbjP/YqhG family protein [Erwinia amylovora]